LLGLALLSGCPKPTPDSQSANQAPAENAASAPAASAPVATPPAANSPTPAATAPTNPVPATTPAPEVNDSTREDANGSDVSPLRSGNADIQNPDRSCKTDSDCTVKDVGNCCGYFPMCTHKNAKTDPKAVQAQCAKSGMASVCGFQEVSGCQCVQGRCENLADGAAVM
jgi:hypothetical protein